MFSAANVKIAKLADDPALAEFFVTRKSDGSVAKRKRKVYSFDLASGYSCPYARECLSKVKVNDKGKRKIFDGPDTKYRCFSASQEALFSGVYNKRFRNFQTVRSMNTDQLVLLISEAMPDNLGVCRIHVAGDFYSQAYFDAWLEIAKLNPSRLFYAYTKSLPFWVRRIADIPDNFRLTASYGGRRDDLIDANNLRKSVVVYHPENAEALGLEIDHDDSHAAKHGGDFALLIHGTQPKGSEASDAIRKLKKEGVKYSYGKE